MCKINMFDVCQQKLSFRHVTNMVSGSNKAPQDPEPLTKPDFEAIQRQHRIVQGLNDNFQRKDQNTSNLKYQYSNGI